MTLPYVIDTGRRRARATLAGRVAGCDIAETIEAIYLDPHWQSGFDSIWDATGITELLLDMDEVSRFLNLKVQYQTIAGPGRIVLLVSRSLDYGMAKVFAVLAKGGPRSVHVVKTESDVTQILG